MASLSKSSHRLIRFAAGFALAVLVVTFVTPNFIGGGPRRPSQIEHNLRQLDGAMQLWALDHNKTGAVAVTLQDLAPYLPPSFKPVAGEKYILKTIADSPEARLTRPVGNHPSGTVARFGTNGGFEFVAPQKQNNRASSTWSVTVV